MSYHSRYPRCKSRIRYHHHKETGATTKFCNNPKCPWFKEDEFKPQFSDTQRRDKTNLELLEQEYNGRFAP